MSERFKYDMDKINKAILENTYVDSIIDKVIIERNKSVDSAVIMEIQKIAVEGGIETKFTLNERNILNALKKQIPQKPTPHKIDIEGGVKIGNVIWGKNTTAYRCPCCDELISKVYLYCYKCGQAIDWSE